MDSFEFNKVAGAVLGTFTFVMLVSFGGELLFAEKKPAKAGYEIAMASAANAPAAAAAPADEPIAVRLAAADAAKGANVFKQCAACHTPDKGGANKVGPNLWGVVGRELGKVAGFGYSAAIKGKGGTWDFEALDKFVLAPKAYVQGTTMAFAGISNGKTRADLIAYLNSISDSPVAIPK